MSDFIHLHGLLGRSTPEQASIVGPEVRDHDVECGLTRAMSSIGHDVRQVASQRETGSGREKARREAIERGENEGMAVPSEKKIALRRGYGTTP